MSAARVAVLGAGANGAGIGADLVRAGHDVTFIEQWPAHVEAMKADGLVVQSPDGTETTQVTAMHLCEVVTLRHTFDVVFLVVKAYDSRWACELIAPYVAPDGVVVGLQNGMTTRTIEAVLGPDRTLGAVIEVGSALFTPGIVERHTTRALSWFALGGVNEAGHRRAAATAELLRAAGTVELVDDIESAKWMKLTVNASELVTAAIVDLPMVEAAKLPGMGAFMRVAGREAIQVGLARGHSIVPIFGLDASLAGDPDSFLDAMIEAVYGTFALPHTMTTVHQDWMKGRHSEVNEINGLVVSEATRLGLPADANAQIIRLALQVEAGALTAGRHNLEPLVGQR
jgi:2-dehydropantoate 2-reductase